MKNKYLINCGNISKFRYYPDNNTLQDCLMQLLAGKKVVVISFSKVPYKLVPKGMYFSAYKIG